MKKKIVIILFFLVIGNIDINAQTNLKDNDAFCDQYSKIVELISNDSIARIEFPFKNFAFQIDSKLSFGIGFPFMTRFYIAETLGIDPKNLDLKDSVVIKLWIETEKEDYNKRKIFENSLCLTEIQGKESDYNVYLSFSRKSDKVVFVNASRIYKYPRHTNGIFYLFFFNENNNIDKIYRDNWIE